MCKRKNHHLTVKVILNGGGHTVIAKGSLVRHKAIVCIGEED